MLTHHIAFELSRERILRAEARANLMTRLGDLPKPAPATMFRREVKPLAGIVEVVRPAEKERIRRRLIELTSTARVHSKAS
jgi:hypothetical protein